MKKSKLNLSSLQLKKSRITELNNGDLVYGGVTVTYTPACLTRDPANPNCIQPGSIKNSCTCPAETTPAYTC